MMTQRIFDVENEKDMADLWDILPDDATVITKGNTWDCLFIGNNFNHSIRSFLNINWHDKTEITRPIQECTEADIGKLWVKSFYGRKSMKEHITPEVGDVWQNKTGRLRVYITKVDVWGIIGITSSGAVVSKNMYHLEKYTYLGKSKVNINDLFKTENEE